LAESDSFIDCNICIEIVDYLKSQKDSVELRKLDGYMRTKDVTTAVYHVRKHLIPLNLVTVAKKGSIKKREHIKITEKGSKLTDKTLNRERE
jgi:hypothetical protein